MKKIFQLVTLLTFALTVPAFAQQAEQTITLKDGTSIKGHLSGVANGSYTVESATMGQVKVPASEVLSINAAGSKPTTSPMTDSDGKLSADSLNSVKTNMMQDPQIMSLIQELLKDPQIADLMKDPTIMKDALSMDPQKIQNNPEVQKLMQNPTMQKIIQVTAEKMQNSGSK